MELINCGEQTVNKRFRIPLTKICKDHGIKEGDRIEVFIKKVEERENIQKLQRSGNHEQKNIHHH